MTPAAVNRLDSILLNRNWIWSRHPFPHVSATDVFTADAYRAFEQAFFTMSARMSSYLPQHDTHGTTITPGARGPLTFFASRAWHDLLAGLLGIRSTGHVNLGLHHHRPGSANGFPHNDLNPGWFVDYRSESGIVLAQPDVCSYTTGEAHVTDTAPRRVIRACALIFYIANPRWRCGDGGETGLYKRATDEPAQPYCSIPPINNSLLAFECTPYSFHGFIRNARSQRNSLIMWLHREESEVTRRWGGDAIVNYRV